ncbi:DUF926-domain-containing protein [Phlegmacium glaucopus]|nr:DUF926-domain-containing protein [Phlegmacium glaucopus]
MATIHPSRMGLIPHDMRSTKTERLRGRSPSPRRSRRSPSPPTRPSRSRDRDSGRVRTTRDSYENDRKERSRSNDGRREGRRRSESRRKSPQYEDYRRTLPPPPVDSSAPWRQQPERMYPGRGDQPRHGGPIYGSGGGADFMESRRAQREAQTVNIWPPSPKAPARELAPKRKKSSKRAKRQRSPSLSETSSDEEERRRKERKERKRVRKAKEEDERRERRRHRSRSRRRSSDDESEGDKRPKHQSKDRSRSKSIQQASRSLSRSPDGMDQDDRVENLPGIVNRSPLNSHLRQASSGPPLSDNQDSDDDDIGPQPMQKVGGKKVDERSYGGALLRGEGSAMAAFLQDGIESRIPRRGEIGLTSDQIAQYEDVGYVMSGSRHRRMNAVRMRKENQVISAEEKRGILKLQRDERERREAILREEFSELVNERLKGSTSEPRAK